MDLISVIVPIYNTEAYLERCVESIRRQTYENLQIILVDDGATDNCPRICDNFALLDTRVLVIHQKNQGQGLARNAGLDAARGKYVAFIDSDDWVDTTHIENLYRVAQQTRADVVIGGHTIVYSNGVQNLRTISLKEKVYEGKSIVDEILIPLIGSAAGERQDVLIESSSSMSLYRMDVIASNRIRYISERYSVAEDLHFNVDFLYHASRVAAANETGYYYFENYTSTSRKYHPERVQRTFRFYDTLSSKIQAYGLEQKCKQRVERSFLMKVRVAIRLIAFSNLSRKQKLQEISVILNHDTTRKVLQNHPINVYVPSMRIWLWMMRAKCELGVYCLVVLREKMRGWQKLKRILKKPENEKMEAEQDKKNGSKL